MLTLSIDVGVEVYERAVSVTTRVCSGEGGRTVSQVVLFGEAEGSASEVGVCKNLEGTKGNERDSSLWTKAKISNDSVEVEGGCLSSRLAHSSSG